jgi:hypothetical protein
MRTVPCGIAMRDRMSQHAPGLAPALYLLLLAACFNAVLRPPSGLPVTPYYLLSPLVGFWLLHVSSRARAGAVLLTLTCCYGLVVGVAAGTPLALMTLQILKYAQLFVLLGLLAWLRATDRRFEQRIRRVLALFLAATLAFAALQAAIGAELPAVTNEESGLWLNTFFYTPNDLALFLCAMLLLAWTSPAPWLAKAGLVAAIFALNVRNDAKAILIAGLLMLGVMGCGWLARKLRLRLLSVVMGALGLVLVAVLTYAEVGVTLNEQEVTPLNLVLDPLQRITALDPYDLGGSVFDRTDALIHAIAALSENSWLGLGPGGSVHVLTLPQYELLTAKSLHNAVAELVIDLGPWFLLPFILATAHVVAAAARRGASTRSVARLSLLVGLPFLAVSQSSGYISNYAFWVAAYLIWQSNAGDTRATQRLPLARAPAVPRGREVAPS